MIVAEPGWLRRLQLFFFPLPVASAAEFRQFVAGEAAYLAQKTVIGYCRVKTLLAFEKLMKEAIFTELLHICRWETYSLTLSDTLVLAEGCLRPQDPAAQARLRASLEALYADILAEKLPVHRPQGWGDRLEQFAKRLALAAEAAPAPPEHLVRDTATLVLELAPIHTSLKRNDLEVVLGDLGFHIVALRGSMRKRFRPAALLAELAA